MTNRHAARVKKDSCGGGGVDSGGNEKVRCWLTSGWPPAATHLHCVREHEVLRSLLVGISM